MIEVVEREDGYIGTADVARYFAPFEEWDEVERSAAEMAKGRILDIGCGPGRHSVEFLRQGFSVVGVDSSPLACEVARERGVGAFEASVEDVSNIGLGSFDTFFLGGFNIGLLQSSEKAKEIFSTLHEAANNGAVIVGVGADPYSHAGAAHAEYRSLNVARGRLPGQERIRIRTGKRATSWFDYLFVSPSELALICEDTPWCIDMVKETKKGYAVRLKLR
ncbi:class I SAM-dependent methyltransferase [Streptomyces sp. NPDC088354]|uniref:class I SAM-dependent methyltransferase n=1 Tax=Streptomyces sp. NPDC088354 TaxID=3365856 RepID=UPI003805BED8